MADEGFLTEQQAAAEIGALMTEEAPSETREVKFKARVKAKKAKPEPAPQDPEPEAEGVEKEAAEPEAVEEQDGGGDDEGPQDDEESPKRLLKVKVDGIEQEVPEDEVVKGYSRQADYTRKTQQLAEDRKRFEAEVVEPLQRERQEYLTALDALASFLPVQGREPDWAALAAELPDADFKQRFAEWHDGQRRWKQVQEQRELVAQRGIAEAQRALKARIAEEMEKLKGVIPEFADSVKAREKQADLVAYAKSLGFSDDDLAGVTDHRLIVLLEHSRLWSEQQKRRPKIEDKIDRALDTIKPNATKSKPRAAEVDRLHTVLKTTGSVDDAAALIEKMGLT